jgi:1,4-alpha-glucan branching enzyme
MTRGCLALLLHAHLPFVRHPEQEQCVEERWLFDAITECYLPLLGVFRRLLEEGVPYRLTLSLSPTLLAMLGDRLLRERYLDHLGRQGEVARREAARCSPEPARAVLADRHARRCAEAERSFREDHGCDLMGSFRGLEQAGVIELATTAATHGYLPLLRHLPGAVSAQLRVSAELFPGGAPPGSRGLWLPECGYFPGLEGAVADAGFGYFLVDSHGIPDPAATGGAVSRNGIRCANGVAALGRDPGCARRVWDARAGYPGHPSYRE